MTDSTNFNIQGFISQKDIAKKVGVSLRTIKRHAADLGVKDQHVSGVIGYSKVDAQKILASFNKSTNATSSTDLKKSISSQGNGPDNDLSKKLDLIYSSQQLLSKKTDSIDARLGMPLETSIGGVAAQTIVHSADVQSFCSKLVTKAYLSSILDQFQQHLADQINTANQCETQTQLKLVQCTKTIVGNQIKLGNLISSLTKQSKQFKLSDGDIQRIAQAVTDNIIKNHGKENNK